MSATLATLLHQLQMEFPKELPFTLALKAQAVTGRIVTGARAKQILTGKPFFDPQTMATPAPEKLFSIDVKLFPNTRNTKIDLDGSIKFNSVEIDALCSYLKDAPTDEQGRVVLKIKGWRRVSEKGNKYLSCLSEVMASQVDDAAQKLADEFDGELI
jgi:hypothetical protein